MAKRATQRNIFGLGKKTTYRVTRAPGRSNETTFKGARVWQAWPEGFKTSADPDSTFDTLKDAKAFISAQQRNPVYRKKASTPEELRQVEAQRAYTEKIFGNVQHRATKLERLKSGAKKRAALNPGTYGIGDERGVPIGPTFHSQSKAFAEARSIAASGQRVEVVWKGANGRYQSRWFGKRRNPSEAAAEVYEEFHGRPSSEVVTVSEKIHYHKNLAALGELRNLVVLARDGAKVTLSRFKKAILCTNEQKDQLFVRGGDQAVDVREFGIKTPHEVETLGKVLELAYFTRKDHLGDEGGTALYFHVAGETNENGKRKMAGWSPDLIYRVRDEALEFSGGSYTIRAEGVDK
jgi:hypothetical protein